MHAVAAEGCEPAAVDLAIGANGNRMGLTVQGRGRRKGFQLHLVRRRIVDGNLHLQVTRVVELRQVAFAVPTQHPPDDVPAQLPRVALHLHLTRAQVDDGDRGRTAGQTHHPCTDFCNCHSKRHSSLTS